jgi:hypothetical protein
VLRSGPAVARGFVIYATDIAPSGVETIEDIIVHCFGGDATAADVSHAVAVRRSSGGLQFEQTDDPYQWVLPTRKLEIVHIEWIFVAAVQFTGSRSVIIDKD